LAPAASLPFHPTQHAPWPLLLLLLLLLAGRLLAVLLLQARRLTCSLQGGIVRVWL